MATDAPRRIQFHVVSATGLPTTNFLLKASTLEVSVKSPSAKSVRKTSSVRRRDTKDAEWHENLSPMVLTDFSLIHFDVAYRLPWLKSSRTIASSGNYRLDTLIGMQGELERGRSLSLILTSPDKRTTMTLVLNIRELSTNKSAAIEAAVFRSSSISSEKKTLSIPLEKSEEGRTSIHFVAVPSTP